MGGTVYQLLGYPGTGKYTIAKEVVRRLRARGEGVSLMDNHATADLVWELVPQHRWFDADVMERLMQVRMLLLDAAVELSPPDQSFIATNFVSKTTDVFAIPKGFAERRGAQLVCVVLECDREEILRRVPSPGRAERKKLVNVEVAARILDGPNLVPDWEHVLRLDITGLSVEEAATQLLQLTGAVTLSQES